MSAAHVVADQVAFWTYGRAQLVRPGDAVWDAFEEHWREVYDGGAASDWAPDPVYVRIVPERFFAYAFVAAAIPTEPAATDGTRVEHDTMGEVRVPAGALYRAQTQRAVENFPVSGEPVPVELVHALARIKEAAAATNAALGVLPRDVADAIVLAARAVAAGEHDDQFPVDVFQTGSGTSTNMNVNEVLATLASRALDRPVHPNDDVNASQSSNDDFPSAVHLAALQSAREGLLPALDHLAATFEAKAAELDDVVKSGRTHLMDAVPVTVGQELHGYATQVRRGAERVAGTLPRVAEIPLGGTAVGTGLNTPPGWRAAVVAELAAITGQPRHRGPGRLRGAVGARRAGRAVRAAAGAGGQPHEDLQRPPLDGLRAARRPRRAAPSGPAAGVLDHARQGEPGGAGGGAAGRAHRSSGTTRPSPGAGPPARSSSTSWCP